MVPDQKLMACHKPGIWVSETRDITSSASTNGTRNQKARDKADSFL